MKWLVVVVGFSGRIARRDETTVEGGLAAAVAARLGEEDRGEDGGADWEGAVCCWGDRAIWCKQ